MVFRFLRVELDINNAKIGRKVCQLKSPQFTSAQQEVKGKREKSIIIVEVK